MREMLSTLSEGKPRAGRGSKKAQDSFKTPMAKLNERGAAEIRSEQGHVPKKPNPEKEGT